VTVLTLRERSPVVKFREVDLAGIADGRLLLHSMPGRYDALEDAWSEVQRTGVRVIVCLASQDEVEKKSPEYAVAINADEVPVNLRRFPIGDFEGPGSDEGFRELAQEVAASLRAGDGVLVLCGAGIGRTGMAAIAVLLALGVPLDEAERRVRAVGSGPERLAQEEALQRLEGLLAPGS
jgi:protein-tyrosine phosphatase